MTYFLYHRYAASLLYNIRFRQLSVQSILQAYYSNRFSSLYSPIDKNTHFKLRIFPISTRNYFFEFRFDNSDIYANLRCYIWAYKSTFNVRTHNRSWSFKILDLPPAHINVTKVQFVNFHNIANFFFHIRDIY